MKKCLMSLCLAGGLIGFEAAAIDVQCNTGQIGGLTKTAYVTVKTENLEYFVPGFFYTMMTSIDINQNIRGQWAVGGNKSAFQPASAIIYIAGVDIEGAWRKVNGSGGLSLISGDICQSAYTQVIY